MSTGERLPRRVAVIGAGTMGAGIGLAFALAGASSAVVSRTQATLERARRQIDASLATLVEHGRVDRAQAASAVARIVLGTETSRAVDGAALVVESVAEDLGVKQRVLAEVASLAAADAVIATNTSSLPLDALARAVAVPERFAGMHWFNPPELVELVELAPAPETAARTIERLLAWSLGIGKRPVRVELPVAGLVANRLQYALMREAYALVRAGVCDFEAIDTAVTAGLGPRWAALGPIESMDLAGLDVHLAVASELFPTLDAAREAPDVVRDAVLEGRLGAKSGAGLRGSYDEGRLAAIAERRAQVLVRCARLDSPAP
jgi:3-hydroxybutyryl-CoA dehydrogenase